MEISLDPADWDAERRLAHRMLDDMYDMLANVRTAPVWKPVPDEVKTTFDTPLPRSGRALEEVYDRFKNEILPYPTGNIHPRFWGWVMGNGTTGGMLAELLTAAMNCHVAGYDQSALYVEQQVIRWLSELVGYPESASGLLVTGGTAANLTGFAVARQAKAGFDVRRDGLQTRGTPTLKAYGSSETHSWIYKACELMGLGRNAFTPVETDSSYRINVAECREAIRADLARGLKPFCIVATAGTVNTGAVDDLTALRELADEFSLWLHVDGAFGSLAALSSEKAVVAGQELADSIAFDLHKWGYMQYEIGAVLIRAGEHHRDTFAAADSAAPEYLQSASRGIAVDTTYFADLGVQLSRNFRALKAWLSFQYYGADRIGAIISQNIDQARHLGRLVEAHDRLELLAPVGLNIVCFRYTAPGLTEAELNSLNQEILVEVQESGVAVPSQTWLGGRFAIRVCNTNHRSRSCDFDMLVEAVVRTGDQLKLNRASACARRATGR